GAILCTTQDGFSRQIGARITIHEELSVGRDTDGMICLLGGKQPQILSVQSDAVQMSLIRILILLAAARRKVHSPILFVDVFDSPNDPRALGYLIFKLSSLIVEIEMIPAIPL